MMTRHSVIFRNSLSGIRVEEVSKSSANIIFEGPPAGTQVRAEDVSAAEMITIGNRLLEIGRRMVDAGGSPKSTGNEPVLLLTAEDVAFNRATADCEAWCKVNLDLDLKGNAARKQAVLEEEGPVFPRLFQEALAPLLDQVKQDEKLSGFFKVDGSHVALAEIKKLNAQLPPQVPSMMQVLDERDGSVKISKKELKGLKKKAKSPEASAE